MGGNNGEYVTVDFFNQKHEIVARLKELVLKKVFGFSGGENYSANQFSADVTSPEYNHSILDAYHPEGLTWEYDDQIQNFTDLINESNGL